MKYVTLQTLIAMCAIGQPEPVREATSALLLAHSGGATTLVVDRTGGARTVHPTAAQAAQSARALIAAGHDVRLGPAGLHPDVLTRRGADTIEAFDACLSARLAAEELAELLGPRAARSIRSARSATRAFASFYDPSDPMSEGALELASAAWLLLSSPKAAHPQPSFAKPARRIHRRAVPTHHEAQVPQKWKAPPAGDRR